VTIRHAYAATGTNDTTKQVSVDRWNEDHVIDAEILLPLVSPAPAPPAADTLAVYAAKLGGRMMLVQKGPSGLDTSFQANLGGNKVALWMPPGNSTTVPGVFGMAALTATGTATSRPITAANLLTRMTRLAFVSAATAGSLCGAREAVLKYSTGAGGKLGGFFARFRFGLSDNGGIPGARMFVGLWASTVAPTNVEPNTLLNAVGVCQLSTSNNMHVMVADGVTRTVIDLGAAFPCNTTGVDAYELILFAPAAGGVVHWQVSRLNTDDVAQGSFTANLPLSNQLLAIQAWRTNNTIPAFVAIDLCGIYIETDY
jgi:hypothetical protein